MNIDKPSEMTREELITLCSSLKATLSYSKSANRKKDSVIRNYKHHLKFIISKLEYLIEHPYTETMGDM